jgi:DNA-binding response OmpR family regulator
MTKPARILIVDDDETVLQTFAKALSLEGYDVRIAASPLVGLQAIEETAPDAILLDLRMPFVNGVGFLYRLRALSDHRDTPVAIITGDSCIDDPAMVELAGLEAEVRFKPTRIDEVDIRTRELLAKSRPANPLYS